LDQIDLISKLLTSKFGLNAYGGFSSQSVLNDYRVSTRVSKEFVNSTNTSSQNSSDKCLKQAFISIDIEGILENKRKLVISGNGSTFSNVSDDKVEILNYVTDCVAGDYSFKYTYNMGQSYQKTINGSFSLDGKNDSYEIVVDAFGSISIKNL